MATKKELESLEGRFKEANTALQEQSNKRSDDIEKAIQAIQGDLDKGNEARAHDSTRLEQLERGNRDIMEQLHNLAALVEGMAKKISTAPDKEDKKVPTPPSPTPFVPANPITINAGRKVTDYDKIFKEVLKLVGMFRVGRPPYPTCSAYLGGGLALKPEIEPVAVSFLNFLLVNNPDLRKMTSNALKALLSREDMDPGKDRAFALAEEIDQFCNMGVDQFFREEQSVPLRDHVETWSNLVRSSPKQCDLIGYEKIRVMFNASLSKQTRAMYKHIMDRKRDPIKDFKDLLEYMDELIKACNTDEAAKDEKPAVPLNATTTSRGRTKSRSGPSGWKSKTRSPAPAWKKKPSRSRSRSASRSKARQRSASSSSRDSSSANSSKSESDDEFLAKCYGCGSTDHRFDDCDKQDDILRELKNHPSHECSVHGHERHRIGDCRALKGFLAMRKRMRKKGKGDGKK